MSNRCPDCNKFVSLELEEPEVIDLEIDDTGAITGEVRVCLSCAECGTEMKEYTFEIDYVAEDVLQHAEDHQDQGEEYELEITEDSVDSLDEMETKDRNGKPIKNYRYMKHYYGYSLDTTVVCSCGDEISVTLDGKEQASAFDELN